MIRMTARYRNQTLELEHPLGVEDGSLVMIEIYSQSTAIEDDWDTIGMERLEEEWDNPDDAIYDDWRTLYNVSPE